jgi:alkyl sulfatase BDS1-like metallo-beta-lactamase superfamily hydrolase
MPADLTDRTDFDNAERGLIARLEPGVIRSAAGQVVWDIDAFGRATRGECPETVNRSLWRQSQLALYRAHRGERPVTAVIYTHSHLDHFGGVLGVVDAGTAVPVIAPEHFMAHAVSENVYAGIAMLRRGIYYSGTTLPVGPEGRVGMGLGAAARPGPSA